ncbi:MAG TPA: F0F1 ATP synthase subunit B [Thermopetrobacter sp.]|nr:F0F1 ATP synthase subunit B [Thermopetrobacter sp.]
MMFATPEFWVAVSFFLFLALLVWFGVPRMVTKALDERAETIRKDIEEARRLREEAQKLLAEQEKRREETQAEVTEIMATARAETEAVQAQMRHAFEDMIARKKAAAEQKIAQAADSAVRDIRARTAALSVAVAEEVLKEQATGKTAGKLIDEAIATIGRKLH